MSGITRLFPLPSEEDTPLKRTTMGLAAVLIVGSCTDSSAPTGPNLYRIPITARAIVDGANNGGNQHFFWLPPTIQGSPSYSGITDPAADPDIEICFYSGGHCVGSLTAFDLASGLSYQLTSESYRARWYIPFDDMNDGDMLRMTASVEGTMLGYADILVVDKATGKLRNETRGEYLLIGDDSGKPFLEIRFRVEVGAAVDDGLLAYWPLDGVADDASGNGYDGTISGAVSAAVDRFGVMGRGLSFDGGHIVVGDAFDDGGPKTFTGWFYLRSACLDVTRFFVG